MLMRPEAIEGAQDGQEESPLYQPYLLGPHRMTHAPRMSHATTLSFD